MQRLAVVRAGSIDSGKSHSQRSRQARSKSFKRRDPYLDKTPPPPLLLAEMNYTVGQKQTVKHG